MHEKVKLSPTERRFSQLHLIIMIVLKESSQNFASNIKQIKELISIPLQVIRKPIVFL